MQHHRSPYLRDRLADMPVFRDRGWPLPVTPKARCSQATAASLRPYDRRAELAARGLPPWLPVWLPAGSLEIYFDDSLPDGVIEIDGTRITLDEMRAACEGP
jgi:hypothetical protein